MSSPSARSPCPTSVASRLSSPLNPTSSSFSSPGLSTGHTPRNSPVSEMSDTLSPLRECSGFASSPRTSPSIIARSRASSFSRSPERSPAMSSISHQPHRTYMRHSPGNSPYMQGIPFPCSPSLSSSPLADSAHSPLSCPLSPLNSPRPGSPVSIHSTHSCAQVQRRLLRSPSYSTPSHFHLTQGAPVQQAPSPSRYMRTQSLIQQSFGSPYMSQGTPSPPDKPRGRRVSLGAEPHTRASLQSRPLGACAQDAPAVQGDATPLNGAPVRWWGRRGWVDDWDTVAPSPHVSRLSEHDGAMGVGCCRSGCSGPLTCRALLGRGTGAFLDEELRASLDLDGGFAQPLSPGLVHLPMGAYDYRMDGVPVGRAAPLVFTSGNAPSRMRRDGLGYNENEAGRPPVDGIPCTRTQDNHCNVHSCSPAPDAASVGPTKESAHGGHSRRASDASTHTSTSYASCLSGPSQSQSQSHLMSPSPSHTSTCLSLCSLGIGIEEAEREELRSRTIWRRRNSGSAMKRHVKNLSNGTSGHGEEGADAGSKLQTSDKDTKHGSSFFRGSKHVLSDDQAQHEGYNRAQMYVSLAITSILSATTITTLSPVGEALVKAKDSAKYVGHEFAPVVKETLSVSANLLSLVPIPGLEEAAKALLCVWDACQKVDTNRLSCLRLAERCATLLYSVQLEINEAGTETASALAEPIKQLCGALAQIRTFLETQLHRPFLKRYVKREEIARELVACNEAITDAASRFSVSIQIRTYHQVVAAMNESRRFAHEAQMLLSLDQQMIQRHYAMMHGSQVQHTTVARIPSDNALGLMTDDVPADSSRDLDGVHLMPPPPHLVPSVVSKPIPAGFGAGSGHTTPTSSILSTGYLSDKTNSTTPATPTPTRATFFVEETHARATMVAHTHPILPMEALAQLHRAQDAVDAAADEAALRGTLAGALDAKNDVEMVRCLQVARGEISEAAETLRRMLGAAAPVKAGADGNEVVLPGKRLDGDDGVIDLDRKFMRSGIDAMTRLTKQPQSLDKAAAAIELPSWTITRYEVIRTCKIGMGFFSDVYLGHWRNQQVVIKVLAHSVSREAFMRHAELWMTLDHPNVLLFYGASSAVGEKPWFFVSKFCSGGNLVTLLKHARMEAATAGCVDLLKSMSEIARGMAYLHSRGVLHGDLRAANVLIGENGQCILSDFGQREIKSEAHQSCGQPELRPIRWSAPEMLVDSEQQTCAADMYTFAICCVEILAMGDLPWETLDDEAIRELVLVKDERPPIPMLAGSTEVAEAVVDLVQSCWVREPDCRPTFASVASSLEEIQRLVKHGSPQGLGASTPVIKARLATIASTESSPADEHYQTASESMMTGIEEEGADMTDVPLTSPMLVLGNESVVHVGEERQEKILTHAMSDVVEPPMPSPTSTDTRHEEIYRLIVGSNHAFHNSLTLPLWSPTRVELGAVGYLSRPMGEFVTLFNAIDPLQSSDERLCRLPSMYGYGKFEVQKREDGKRSMAQRSLEAISGFLTFKSRGDRSHPERIARQYAFPLVQGKPLAQLCVEKTVHRFMDNLEVPKTWFRHHVDFILEVFASCHAIQREDLILVVGTLDAPDWAVFASDSHADGRAQFNVFSNREKGEPWGTFTVERAVENGNAGSTRWAEVRQGVFASKVSCVNDVAVGDTVMVSGLRFERGMQTPRVM